MTIIDALKSGKPFRRRGQLAYYTVGPNSDLKYLTPGLEVMTPRLDAKDILTDDWEVQPTYKNLCAKDIRDAAVSLAMREDKEWCTEELIRELGL